MPKLLVDPELPQGFDNTPNEERTELELERWWGKPFACTNEDGSLDIRCLDGGAWDRSTFYGRAASLEEAEVLAGVKLSQWIWLEKQPVVCLGEGTLSMVVMPNRPGAPQKVVAQFSIDEKAEAEAWLAQWRESNPMPNFEDRKN